jgi:hypothetical protein
MEFFRSDIWSGGKQLFWSGQNIGDTLELALPVPIDGEFEICARFTMARDFGVVQVYLDDKPLGGPIDLYSYPDVITTGVLHFGKSPLTQGNHRFGLKFVGMNPAAVQNGFVGIDFLAVDTGASLAYRPPGNSYPIVSASYTNFPHDPAWHVNDGLVEFLNDPPSRWTCFGSPNLQDWLQLEFDREIDFSSVQLAIYDDSPGSRVPHPQGRIRAPNAYAVEYFAGEEWKPVKEKSRSPEKPTGWQWNVVNFETVTAKKVRVVFTHQEPYKSGVTEIAVWP